MACALCNSDGHDMPPTATMVSRDNQIISLLSCLRALVAENKVLSKHLLYMATELNKLNERFVRHITSGDQHGRGTR